MKTVIFGGAPIREYGFCREHLKDADAIICCDAGMRHAKAMGIDPDYIVGDFDSTASDVLEYYKEKNIPIRQFPTRKDETDMELGIFLALELGATDVVLFGGIGDRFDHTLANAHYLLSLLKKGVRARLVDDKNCVEVIDRHLTLEGKVGELVSTLPLSMEVTGITLKGFSYPLTDATLTLDGDYIAVSNVLAEETATIDIKSGYLFVIKSRD
ncbi:MAG: thiamine diphosphokinase [Anaerotignum sp.]|nr:thiamine diphosphokinase [Anaerotignum sp.]MBQ7084442.1 thiamine diphosphokinase [Anaerotignum sp.]